MAMHPLDRRRFLQGSLALSGLALADGALPVRPVREKTLVVLQLSGGNDGLSTVVPFRDRAYQAARASTRIDEDEILPLADGIGLHPALGGLRDRFDEGRLAIVRGVGYPSPNRSHFESLGIWHGASSDRRATASGWIGRLAEVAFGVDRHPNRIVHVGSRVPFSVYSPTHPAASFEDPAAYRFAAADLEELAREQETTSGSPSLKRLRAVFRDAARSSAGIRETTSAYRTDVDYPKTDLAESMRTTAALLKSDAGCRVVSLEQTGYDTHGDQRGRHDRLMEELDGALSAFLGDLAGSAAEETTTVMVFSEFGRRVAENGSRGTDHGKAGPMLLLGAPVRGGFHGDAPSLEDLDSGDLSFTTDFRAVYASVVEGVFGVEHERVLGARYETLPVLA